MSLISPIPHLKKALQQGFALGGFNANNLETIRGISEAAKEENTPFFLMFEKPEIDFFQLTYIHHIIQAIINDLSIDIILHLDHGKDPGTCIDCIEAGFTSVMIDGSELPLEDNIRITREVVEVAHASGVAVEAELGRLETEGESRTVSKDIFTDPDEACYFIEKSGCDSLAVSIGTSHGAYKYSGQPYLDLERLNQIQQRLPEVPLVLHGASSVPEHYVQLCNDHGGELSGARGLPDEIIVEAAKMNICKVNTDTDLRLTMTATIRREMHSDPQNIDPEQYLLESRRAVKEIVKHKLRILKGHVETQKY